MSFGATISEERVDRNGSYKSLQSASAANATGMVWYRADYELHWLRKLRKESVKIGRLMKHCRTFKGYAELSRALIELCERERILLRIPLPAAAPAKQATPTPIAPAAVMDVTQVIRAPTDPSAPAPTVSPSASLSSTGGAGQ